MFSKREKSMLRPVTSESIARQIEVGLQGEFNWISVICTETFLV